MFARLDDHWYLNLDDLHEVYFESEERARIISVTEEDDGLMEWFLSGADEVAHLKAALREYSLPLVARVADGA